jgi:CheY-like chemotaxis protein
MSDSQTTATPVVHELTDQAATDSARHVLVAAQNERSCARRRLQLRESGYLVTIARTSFETIVKACCHLPELVVLDDSLGRTEVEETARLLATCPVTSHIPVVRLGSGRRLPQRVLTRLQRVAV